MPESEETVAAIAAATARDRFLIAARGGKTVRKSNLRPALTSFVGRAPERAELARTVGASRLLTITGPAGCGKTRIALEVAQDLADANLGGVFVAELDAVVDGRRVPAVIAAALGVDEDPDLVLLDVIAEVLGDEPTLLVLDNCEHLLDACARAATELLTNAPGLRILATSHEPLGVAGEAVWPLAPLTVPEPQATDVAAIHTSDAVSLFCERARLGQPSFTLDERNAGAVVRICRGFDGLPLAIELAAARIPLLQPQEIAERLHEQLDDLRSPHRDLPDRQRTLRAAFDWGHGLLAEPEQILFRRLGVFAGGFSLPAAEQVCGDHVLDRQEILGLLGALVRRSLVRAEDLGGRTRYRMLETLRRYAGERLSSAGEQDELERRHLRWALPLAEDAASELSGPDQSRWMDLLELEHDNLRTALRWALDDDPPAAQRLAAALARFWEIRGHISEGRGWLEAAAASGTDSPARAPVLLHAAVFARMQRDYTASRARAQEALTLLRDAGDERGVASSLAALGSVEWSDGAAQARSLSSDSIAIDRLLAQTQRITGTVDDLGTMAWEAGDPASVRTLHEQALEIARRRGDPDAEAASLLWLGNVAFATADHTGARARYEEALALLRRTGNRRRTADALGNLGLLAQAEGDLAGAAQLHTESLELRRAIGHRRGIAVACLNLGDLALASGRTGEAHTLFAEARDLADGLGDERIRAVAVNRLPSVDDAPAREDGPPAATAATLRREGEIWAFVFDGRPVRVKDAKGVRHLATLLAHPRREFHVLDLARGGASWSGSGSTDHADRLVVRADPFGDAGEVLDPEAKEAYRARIRELDEEIEDAEAWSDPERSARAREEREQLVQQLASAVGLGGRDRAVSGASERARWSVSRTIRSAIRRIGEHHPALADHLEHAVRTGTFCTYEPDPALPLTWEVSEIT